MKPNPELAAAVACLALAAACTDPHQASAEAATRAAEPEASPLAGDVARLAAAARSDELAKAWMEASRDVPNLVYAIDDRLDILSGAKKLPKGLDASAIEWARQSLAAIESSWSKAQERFRNGDTAGAVAASREAKAQASEILGRIGMP